MGGVTRILAALEQADLHMAAQLLPLVYQERRRLAAQKLAQEKPGQTLQATALVHEAYLRLVSQGEEQHWNSRGHVFAAAAKAMRHRLVENATEAAPQTRLRPATGVAPSTDAGRPLRELEAARYFFTTLTRR